MDQNHEEQIIKSFIVKRLQDRVLFELSTKKYRDKLHSRLTNYFETTVEKRYIRKIDFIKIPEIIQLLKREGAPSICYVCHTTKSMMENTIN
ncbi:hypothetical protein [Niallia taxi]|uniref:hypothetical protein n=1 Tax=Niallia taxi TaxID=2499688 RepID=UPI0015F403C9|nr:hypothetical protein [Niallia taxi]